MVEGNVFLPDTYIHVFFLRSYVDNRRALIMTWYFLPSFPPTYIYRHKWLLSFGDLIWRQSTTGDHLKGVSTDFLENKVIFKSLRRTKHPIQSAGLSTRHLPPTLGQQGPHLTFGYGHCWPRGSSCEAILNRQCSKHILNTSSALAPQSPIWETLPVWETTQLLYMFHQLWSQFITLSYFWWHIIKHQSLNRVRDWGL